MLSRRQALTATLRLAGAAAGQALVGSVRAETARDGNARVPYGSCVRPEALETEVDYRAAFLTHCQQITPEGGLYWGEVHPTRQQFNFDKPDRVLEFARANGMAMRGHTLVWYGAMPDWTKQIHGAGEAERELNGYIERVMSRYRGKIKIWHVVNEPIDDAKYAVPGLRPNIWLQQLGERYVDMAFRTAHRVDPAAELLLNEYDVEFADATAPKKRQALLSLVRGMLDRGVPIHGVGLQGHLRGQLAIDRDGLSKFVSEIRSLGLSVHVTELDVLDDLLPASVPQRDTIAAARAFDFLETIFAAGRPAAIVTWGITDRYTWVPMWYKRKDGLPNRPLPFDANYQPKPLWNVIDYFCQQKA
jgi:endo-1,4-beta-xylanase